MTSGDTTEASVPSSITIPIGASFVQFDVTGVDDADVDGTQIVGITAAATGFQDGVDTVDVTDDDVATLNLIIAADAISENGGVTTATLTRNTDTASALTVTMTSGDTTEASVPSFVTIPIGTSFVQFDVTGVDDADVDGTQVIGITAAATGFQDGLDTVDVTDDDVATLGLLILADSISENGGVTTATLTRNTDTAVALTVTLQNTDITEASVPPTVTIPIGASTTQFDIEGVDDLDLDGNQIVTITALATGFQSGVDDLEVTDDDEVSSAGLVAHWTFDERTGTVAGDWSPFGQDNPGTLVGDTTWSPDGTVVFDGIGDAVTVADSPDINLGTHAQRTISLWFRADDVSISTQKQVLFEEGGTTRGLNVYLSGGSLYVGGWNISESGWTGTFLNTNQVFPRMAPCCFGRGWLEYRRE